LFFLGSGGPLLLLNGLQGADGGEDVAGFGFLATGYGNDGCRGLGGRGWCCGWRLGFMRCGWLAGLMDGKGIKQRWVPGCLQARDV
jgi:hypothetical protein